MQQLKRLVWRMIGSRAAFHLLARVRNTRSVVLAYHNIVPDDWTGRAGEPSLHLPAARFRSQVRELKGAFDIVPLLELLNEPHGSRRPRLAITFDDAYAGVLRLAAPWLNEERLPYCVFVAPGLLGSITWWDEVLGTPMNHADRLSARKHALHTLRGDGEAVRAWWRAGRSGQPDAAEELRIATADQLSGLNADAMASVGAHSWSHRVMTRLNDQEVGEEIRSCSEWLGTRFGNYVPLFAYPYGAFDERVSRAVAAAGFAAAVTVDDGWVANETHDAFRDVARISIPGGADLSVFRGSFLRSSYAAMPPVSAQFAGK